ncbi:hypothetical protein CIW49_08305 [Mycolicibacterium sp. P1-18]|uniref:hypothetical protein n=1 Tax=Mycolicibacterium sp. P1-18 TaxID=2024615 RepID=UPI0011F3ED67|nr:hypothetical protein [Mycolicibacterium sp. P1-18]KAA0099593.1 hypothetical protein CIW49_08305 [Mycolicibacterium sp. P1-18]
MGPTPPFVLIASPNCCFYRSLDDVVAAYVPDVEIYDAHGSRLTQVGHGLAVTSVEPEELARLLRRWLDHVDASRESTTSWPLWLLVHAGVEHAGYA